MTLVATPLLCPFTIASDIFMLKKDIAKMHCNNARLNISNNAPLAVYQAALAKHWLVMGLKTDSSPIDGWLSKMEAAIKNIVSSLATIGNLAVNKLMECEAAMAVIAKAMSVKEPKWTTMMAKNARWSAKLWRPWLMHQNKRSASSTYASCALRPRKVRPKRS
jgi:hypothetical protein